MFKFVEEQGKWEKEISYLIAKIDVLNENKNKIKKLEKEREEEKENTIQLLKKKLRIPTTQLIHAS